MSVASAPASSANLGPGYDVLALALALRCRVEVERRARWEVRSDAAGGEDLVRAAAEAAVPGCGPLRVTIGGAVPVGRGLGSSAALIVATMAAVASHHDAALGRHDLCAAAAGVEGHPDNVAAAVHGGLVVVAPGGRVHRLVVHPSLRALVAVPEATLSTEGARRSTAGPVATATAARTAARLAFLVEGLRTGAPELLAEAAGDELHEERRAWMSPLTAELVEAARGSGALHAAWSGAGPSAVAFVAGDDAAAAVRRAWEGVLAGGGGSVLEPGIDPAGVAVGEG